MWIGGSEIVLLLVLLAYILLLAYFVHDAVSRDDIGSAEKTFWIIAMYLLTYIGMIAYVVAKSFRYYRMGRREGRA